ncbi:MAG: hypothetical protein JWQ71_3825 [Pedosphaera sp.]|nr:hypothetical protein [Pedosphaera sp.]
MNSMLKFFKLTTLVIVIASGAGCASMVDGGPTVVHINSEPAGAKVSVFDREDKPVYTQTTPASLSLQRSHGYFAGERYKVVFEAPGYYPATRYIDSQINGWYLGNIFFGGVIGLLVVDPMTGAMYTLSPNELNCNLVPSTVAMSPEELKAAELKANPPKALKSTQVQNNSLKK